MSRILQALKTLSFLIIFLKLDKALYGSKQAPRAWYERLSKFFMTNEFKRGMVDNTLFLKSRGKELLIVQVYVADTICGATYDGLFKEFAEMLSNKFKMSMMDDLIFFLGLKIKQSSQGTSIC